jgi:hypothetical protein
MVLKFKSISDIHYNPMIHPGNENYNWVKTFNLIILFLFLILFNGCITEFIPKIEEKKQLLVVQGLLTDQPGMNTVKLSQSLPLGKEEDAQPLSRCFVSISDDMGSYVILFETIEGTYIPPFDFHGIPGRTYTLNIRFINSDRNLSYQSIPVKMKPVPPIDSLYYEKKLIQASYEYNKGIEACQIYLNTHDPEDNCRYYRWDYSETWALRLPFDIPNQKCWMSDKSKNIFIQNTVAFGEDVIKRLPVTYISNATDRLKTKYSIMVNQYSLNEEEYIYWEKLKAFTEQVGGLYDIIPASIPSNIRCIENPAEKVLGYFSVSSITSKRIFIKDNFAGIIDPYEHCITDSVVGDRYIPGIDTTTWILFYIPASPFSKPSLTILTHNKLCSDCSLRGSTIKPLFWIDDK